MLAPLTIPPSVSGQILPGRAADGDGIDAGMQEEAAVLGGQRRLDTGFGQGIQRQIDLLARVGIDDLVEQATVAIQNAGGGAHQARLHRADGRQIGQQPGIEPGRHGQHCKRQHQSGECESLAGKA